MLTAMTIAASLANGPASVIYLDPRTVLVTTPSLVSVARQTEEVWYSTHLWSSGSDAQACGELAFAICGEGRVCSLAVTETSCTFTCQDAHGNCPPVPVAPPSTSEVD